jgi:ABC-type dipeptide/oligopeptide/nickel transport system permease component
MSTFIRRRSLQAVPTLVGITAFTFILLHLAPGDPVSLSLPSDATVDDIQAARHAYGLDQPLPLQYLAWLSHVASGDLGRSIAYRRPIADLLASAVPNTLQLASIAMVVSLATGVPLGLLAARRQGTALDQAVRVLAVTGHAVPSFCFGLLFIMLFSVQTRWLPVGGAQSVGADAWDFADRLRHLVGPVTALSLAGIASLSRLTRAETLEVLSQDYIRTARAKGLSNTRTLYRHALGNALLPVITFTGEAMATLISGAIVIEQVFAWPGMGRLAFDATRARDYPLIMAIVMLSSCVLLASYLARDVAYDLVDPRLRESR